MQRTINHFLIYVIEAHPIRIAKMKNYKIKMIVARKTILLSFH